jgi:hypothetical protein
MCDMATRNKYCRISVSSGEDDIDRAIGSLMEILKRPELAFYVRHIECRKALTWRADYKRTDPVRGLSSEKRNLIQKAVRMGDFIGPKEDRVVTMLMQRMDKALFQFGGYR